MRDVLLILHFLGIAMTVGAGFSNLFLGRVAAKLEPADRSVFISRIFVLAVMGRIGLGVLIITGLGLLSPFWNTLDEMPLLLAKLTLFGILIISVITMTILANKAKKENNAAMMGRLRSFAIMNFLIGLAIVVLAVLAFH